MTRSICSLLFVMALWLAVAPVATAAPTERYRGIDETVVEGAAYEAGRAPSAFFGFLEQGDIPRLMSMLAGLLGGFVLGYVVRGHFHRRASHRSEDVGAEDVGA